VPVTVSPQTFSFVDFSAPEIAALVTRLAIDAGWPEGADIAIRIDEASALAAVEVVSLDPLEIQMDGGALEDPKRPRQLSEHRVSDVVGVTLLQARDRLDPAFAGPALGDELPLAHRVAWEVWAATRLGRRGWPIQPARRRYQFRHRHGFTDAADDAFDRIWSADALTWPALVALSDGVPRPAGTA
jgi:hypothetical protein